MHLPLANNPAITECIWSEVIRLAEDSPANGSSLPLLSIRLERISTGSLDHLPDVARLAVVAGGEHKEIVAAYQPLRPVANRWKTLGADVA